MQYKVVVIGCGHMGEEHLKDIYFRDNIRIAAVVDKDAAKAREAAEKYAADAWGTDYHRFLNRSAADIAIIATNTTSHLPILKDCLENGVHVLCEKPIATNSADAEEFLRAAESSPCRVLVGHILRHNLTYRRVADMIHEGAIGSPVVMRLVQNHHTMDWPRYKRLLADCPPILDCGVHYFDVMQWFTGERIVRLSGVKASVDPDTPENSYNYGLVTVKLSGGSTGYYEAGWGNTIASENRKDFIGPKGRISIVLAWQRLQDREEGDLIEYYRYPQKEYQAINLKAQYKPAYRQLSALIDMIEGKGPASPTLDEVRSSFRAAMAADRALRTGSVVTL